MQKEPATIQGAKIQRNGALIAAILGLLGVAALIYFGSGGGNVQKNSPNANQSSQTGTGNLQALQTGTGNSQTINNYLAATNGIRNQHDDLVLTVSSFSEPDAGRNYSRVLFINNGDRDASIVQAGLWVDVPKGEMHGLLGLWGANEMSETTVIPAGKIVPRRIEMTQFDNVRNQSTTNEYHIVGISCRIIDGDGNQHLLNQNIGKLRFSENGYKYLPLDDASQTVRLLPSKIFKGYFQTSVISVSTNPTLLDIVDDNTNRAAR